MEGFRGYFFALFIDQIAAGPYSRGNVFVIPGSQGFWLGDAIAGFVPLLIGGTFYLMGSWRQDHSAA